MPIVRKLTNKRLSQAVVHEQTVYLAGQVGEPCEPIADQVRTALARVDALLEGVGTNKQHLLQVIILLADLADFDAMNSVWESWVPEGHAPVRASAQAALVDPDLRVEFIVTAAIPR
ncbi:RidA family protein [Pseudomonas sp. CR3202]|uniref:RidA family protein n=1 Tax=Pseudomonas sp. CR3202 TaxID=3351532 RepID=UPI003BF368E1